jgi:hypothetical protein
MTKREFEHSGSSYVVDATITGDDVTISLIKTPDIFQWSVEIPLDGGTIQAAIKRGFNSAEARQATN